MKKEKIAFVIATVFMTLLLSCGQNNNVDSGDNSTDENKPVPQEAGVDFEGNKYTSIEIGNQHWMIENLNTSFFRNGDPIPEAKTNEEWELAGKQKQPAWCYYNNDSGNGKTYGKLYNFFAASDPRGLAPEGWNVPSEKDWKQLSDFLGDKNTAGKRLKSETLWHKSGGDDGNGNNETGFNAYSGGIRFYDGTFMQMGETGGWWSTDNNGFHAKIWMLTNYQGDFIGHENALETGYSVRCVKE